MYLSCGSIGCQSQFIGFQIWQNLQRVSLQVFLLLLGCMGMVVPAGAATITVTANAPDVFIGGDGSCSLREAITNINNAFNSSPDCLATGTYGTSDTIILPAGTYTNAIAGVNDDTNATGDLDIIKSIAITGAGAAATIIDGGGIDRVLDVDPLASGRTVNIFGVTVRNGNTTNGGGIFNHGTLSLTNAGITGNSGVNGGAISNQGTLTVTNSTLSGNTATSRGGGIDNESLFGLPPAMLTVSDSVINGNTGPNGGGIFNLAATAVVTNSTISGNTGSGIWNALASGPTPPLSTVTVTNSTISSNTSWGIISGTNLSVIVNLKNTIVANNTVGDCSVAVTSTLNDLDSDGTCRVGALSNMNPLLGPLANNGGPTKTHALLAGSPAIDAGDAVTCAAAPVNNVDQRGFIRPKGAGCDIGAYEVTLPSFTDVPSSHWAFQFIETIFGSGITSGCGGGNFCPNNNVTRAEMAVFLEKGMNGGAFAPPPATGLVFTDVPTTGFAAAWIEQLSADGITSGCGGGNYCPTNNVTRAEMAVFLERGKNGAAFAPAAATGLVFTDVPTTGFAAAWIEQLSADGITSGCGGGNFCPTNNVTRAEMAVFLVNAFALPL